MRPALYVAVALCVADWVLVQDLGVLGGVGTDPNSMVPMALVFVSGYLAVTRVPAADCRRPTPTPLDRRSAPAHTGGMPETRPWWDRVAPGYLTRVLAAIAAVAVVLVGAVPMAAASINPNADPILAEAVDGTPNVVDLPAPGFQLVDQAGRTVSLTSLRGRTVALTFLDPVCTSDCPLIAQAMPRRQHAARLRFDPGRVRGGGGQPHLPEHDVDDAFDRQEGLEHMGNWLFLTGPLPSLEHVWDQYGIEADILPAGAMIAHSDLAYLIDSRGHTREVLSADPGDGSGSSSSSFSVYIANALERVIHT